MSATPEIGAVHDARDFSDMLMAQELADEAELEAIQPVEHISRAIKALPRMTDVQLKRLIVVLACKANECDCHEMAVAGLDDTGDIL